MIFAAVWGVLQLTVLGSFTRTVRVRAVLGAIAVGFYACAAVAVGLQWGVTRVAAVVSGGELEAVVLTAGFTIDPLIEEVVKITPLLVAGWWLRSKSQWGVTDFVLIGSAFGAGFGLFEAFARTGQNLAKFKPFPSGGYTQTSLDPARIPDFGDIVTSWLPRPVDQPGLFNLETGPTVAPHIVWSSLAALGIGLFFRLKNPARFLFWVWC